MHVFTTVDIDKIVLSAVCLDNDPYRFDKEDFTDPLTRVMSGKNEIIRNFTTVRTFDFS